MSSTTLETERLKLVLSSHQETCAQIDQMSAEIRAQVSQQWLALLHSRDTADPWIHGFKVIDRFNGTLLGSAGFTGPPSQDATVEIAYSVNPEHQGKGYATEAAAALVRYALETGIVRTVRAHTLPQPNASGRVLAKCGFRYIGEVIDPDDGLVWRWETP